MTRPEWSGVFDPDRVERVLALPIPDLAEWAWGGATGAGVRVAVIDSGVDADHPRVGGLARSVVIREAGAGIAGAEVLDGYVAVEGPPGDLVGHGTACAAIIRALAPEAEIVSVRVLGETLKGRGGLFLAGIRWAVDAGIDVLNLSLSSKSETWFGPLHQVADEAYFRGSVLVCAANNLPGPTYPSQYASVISVAARPGATGSAMVYNPRPPVEFGAPGIDVDVAWSAGTSIVASGNSFAAPHVSGLVALLLSKHRGLTPFQVKTVLQATCENAAVHG